MKSIIIEDKYSNKRIDIVLRDIFNNAPLNAIYKAFRKKDIRINGKRVKENHIVSKNDLVEIYILDDILNGVPNKNSIKVNANEDSPKENNINQKKSYKIKGFSIVYEDKNILIVNKNQGIAIHPDINQPINTLIDLVKDYINQKNKNKDANKDENKDKNKNLHKNK